MKTNFGRVSPGDILFLRKTFYSQERQVVPASSEVQVNLLQEDGTLIASLNGSNAQVSVPTNQAYADSFNSAYELDFTLRIPDYLQGSSDGVPLTAMVELSVFDSNGNPVYLTLQEGVELYQEEDIVYGARAAVAMMPRPTKLKITDYSPLQGRKVDLEIYNGNDSVYVLRDVQNSATVAGNTLTFSLPPVLAMPVSIQPYAVLWDVDEEDQHLAPLYVFNPSMHLAMRELHDYVNKNCSDWAMQELTFTPEQLAAALYNGACTFNMVSPPTNFTMTNAVGSTRQFWILYSALWLLKSQVLNSVETDFSYTNASVNLDIDRAAKYQQFADQLEGQLREDAKAFKTVLAKRGNTGGDGSVDPTAMRSGAMGTVIIASSPVVQGAGSLTFNPFSWRSAYLTNL